MEIDSMVRITSWNVAGKESITNAVMNQLFDDSYRLPKVRPDIQIVGLQEAPSFMLRDPWTENLSSTLGKRGYILFKRHSLSGIFLYIFVLREILLRCRDFETESVRTHLLKSKGSVSLRFNYNGRSFCVINSHLTAHLENYEDRINDYHAIVGGTKFLIDPKTSSIFNHDYSLWFGDLNFRFDDISRERVLEIIDKYRSSPNNSLVDLYNHDQLIKARVDRRAFVEFQETRPKFIPTYKYVIETSYEYDKERKPAWTDRVLFRKYTDTDDLGSFGLDQLFYEPIQNISISDHKPLISMFKVKTLNPNQLEKVPSGLPFEVVKFEPILDWRAGSDGRLWYKISNDLFNLESPVLSSWDRVALYRSDFNSLDQYLTFIYPSNIARIAPQMNAPLLAYSTSATNSRSSTPSSSRRGSTESITTATEAISLNDTQYKQANTSNSSVPTLQQLDELSKPTIKGNTTDTTGKSDKSDKIKATTNNSSSTSQASTTNLIGEPIVEDGFKYFTVQFPDELLIPGSYVVLYLKVTKVNEYNVYGMSQPFVVASN